MISLYNVYGYIQLQSSPSISHVSNSRPAGQFRQEHMIVLKIQIYAALYCKLWKCISVTQVSVSIWRSIYMQKWTLVCIWYAVVRIRGVEFFGWWQLHGSCILKGIKRTSSAPPTEKHNIEWTLVWGDFYGVIVMTYVQRALAYARVH